jgi:hypothetical protein
MAMKHLMPDDLATKFHEVLAVILKGVIKGRRTSLATCRCLYVARIELAVLPPYQLNTDGTLYLNQ